MHGVGVDSILPEHVTDRDVVLSFSRTFSTGPTEVDYGMFPTRVLNSSLEAVLT